MNVDPGFTTAEMDRIFSAANRVELFCRFEASLAQAQAAAGMIPVSAAAAITAASAEPVPDPERLLKEGWEVGTPVKVLLEHLRRSLPEEHIDHLHHGATTQDAVDTAAMLQSATALDSLARSLAETADVLAAAADRHRATPSLARTLLQPARSTTHGARFARWLSATTEARREIRRVRERLPIQLGGPIGDAAAFGDSWPQVTEHMATALELTVPAAPWHTDRGPVEAAAGIAARVSGVASKMARDVALLTGAGEIRVRAGGSSSIPDKHNPIDAIRAEAAAEVSRVAAAGLISAPTHALERGMGPWHAEWALLPIAFSAAGAAAEAIGRCISSLQVVDSGETGDEPAGLIERALEARRRLEEE